MIMPPVAINFFDSKLGPVVYFVTPKSFTKIAEMNLNTFDYNSEKGEVFRKDYDKIGMRSINMHAYVNSPWARGGREMIGLSVFTTDQRPAIENFLKEKMKNYSKKILKVKELYKAFYRDTQSHEEDMGNISTIRDKLLEIVFDFDKAVSLETPSTNSYIFKVGKVISKQKLMIPSMIINELKNRSFKENEPHFFAGFFKDGEDNLMVKIIPSGKNVFKLKVVIKKFTPDFMASMKEIITEENLIHTTGICMGSGKEERCSHEAYFTFKGSFKDIKEKVERSFLKIDYVIEAKVERVTLI